MSEQDKPTQSAECNSSPAKPPPKPSPSNDTGIVPKAESPRSDADALNPDTINVWELSPVSALKLLCRGIDNLVRIFGDVPPTPPVHNSRGSSPHFPHSLHHSRTPSGTKKENQLPATPVKEHRATLAPPGFTQTPAEKIDGVPFIKTPIGSPEAHLSEPTSIAVVGANAQPIHLQQGAIARKFYSKRPPPISTEEYLLRMHKYCPMSAGVYIATSCYITRMSLTERILPVTPRNVHRLLLAGLRVAMKALEDLSWPHSRFSKVGGVSEAELGRLEITFCFLSDFVLKVDEKMLQREAEMLARQGFGDNSGGDGGGLSAVGSPTQMELKFPSQEEVSRKKAEKRKASSVLPSRPAIQQMGVEVVGQS